MTLCVHLPKGRTFFANFGWGYNGNLRRSTDGLNWRGKEIYKGSDQNDGWNGIFFTGAEFVGFSNGNKMVSADGMTWSGTPISNFGAVNGPLSRAPRMARGSRYRTTGTSITSGKRPFAAPTASTGSR